jgi:hypothetical protein
MQEAEGLEGAAQPENAGADGVAAAGTKRRRPTDVTEGVEATNIFDAPLAAGGTAHGKTVKPLEEEAADAVGIDDSYGCQWLVRLLC